MNETAIPAPANWNLLRTPARNAAWNMALDEALLENGPNLAAPLLRLYSWTEPAATFGYSQRYSEIVAWTTLRPLIRRPTGGGLVPHDADWTYSLVFPPRHAWYSLRAEESYRQAHAWISESFTALAVRTQLSNTCEKPVLGRCFIGSEKHDVLADGQKIAGAAQKRNKLGLLIQGSIQPPANRDRSTWEAALLEVARRRFGIEWVEMKLPDSVLARAAELEAVKYGATEYNQRR